MKKKLLASIITGLFVSAMAGLANATVITFDEYVNIFHAGGEVNGTEWLSEGILFSTPDAELNLGTTTGSSPNSLGANEILGADDFSGSVYFEFVGNNVVNDLTFTIFNTPFQAEAYDLNGNLLHTLLSGSDFTQFFDFSGYSVHSVLVSGTGYAIDDVSFTLAQQVPEPATILLFGAGMAGLVGVGARRKKKA